MHEHNDIRSVASAVKMLRDADPYKSVLIVEGSHDKSVFENLTSIDDCELEVGYGKQNVCGAVQLLNMYSKTLYPSLGGYLGIVDSDFKGLDGKGNLSDENIVETDGHDLEYMLLNSMALDRHLDSLLETSAHERITICKETFKQCLFELGSQIGYLRLKVYDYCKRYSISCNSGLYESLTIKYVRSLDANHRLSWTAALYCINSTSGFDAYSESEVSNDEWEILRRKHEAYLCHGKDMLETVFCELLPKVTQAEIGREFYVGKERARSQLTNNYDMSVFKKSQLYLSIKAWESHTGFYVLAD
ncbi:MAG: DUF4435 domain-containing protein [Chloroflexota bacterium]|nr:DUF4435 domain-containing protein [Chloroflexota bacterium]MDE2911291.1 DUF4435 domain-containing protein [Chloroflexota bacterium]